MEYCKLPKYFKSIKRIKVSIKPKKMFTKTMEEIKEEEIALFAMMEERKKYEGE